MGFAGDDPVDPAGGRGLVPEVDRPQTAVVRGAQIIEHSLGRPVPGLLKEMVADRQLLQPGQRRGVPRERGD